MAIDKALREKRQEIFRMAARHGVSGILVFGSAARGEIKKNSDIDLVIKVTGPTTPWFPGGLAEELEKFLGRRVDLVELDAVREPLRQRILEEAVQL
jgi:uncharacterized protein